MVWLLLSYSPSAFSSNTFYFNYYFILFSSKLTQKFNKVNNNLVIPSVFVYLFHWNCSFIHFLLSLSLIILLLLLLSAYNFDLLLYLGYYCMCCLFWRSLIYIGELFYVYKHCIYWSSMIILFLIFIFTLSLLIQHWSQNYLVIIIMLCVYVYNFSMIIY